MDKNEKKSVRFRSRFHQSFASFLSAERKGSLLPSNLAECQSAGRHGANLCQILSLFRTFPVALQDDARDKSVRTLFVTGHGTKRATMPSVYLLQSPRSPFFIVETLTKAGQRLEPRGKKSMWKTYTQRKASLSLYSPHRGRETVPISNISRAANDFRLTFPSLILLFVLAFYRLFVLWNKRKRRRKKWNESRATRHLFSLSKLYLIARNRWNKSLENWISCTRKIKNYGRCYGIGYDIARS